MGFKFCPMCGVKLINESFKFCPECGYKFEIGDDPAENNLHEFVNEQNIKNPQDEGDELNDGLANDKSLRVRQIELMKKYGKLTPEKEQEIEQKEKRRREIEEKNRREAYYNTLYAEQSQKEKDELEKWIIDNKNIMEGKYGDMYLLKKIEEEEKYKLEEKRHRQEEKRHRQEEERFRQEELRKREEENSISCGTFNCHYSEKRYNALIGVYPEFFNGVCTINKNRLLIQGKKRQKVILFSNISSIEYNKKLIGASGIIITLSGGNIIELANAPQSAYDIISKLWSQGNY